MAQAEQQAFARAVRAENDGPPPGAQRDVDVVEQAGVTALEDQPADFQRQNGLRGAHDGLVMRELPCARWRC